MLDDLFRMQNDLFVVLIPALEDVEVIENQ